MKAAKCLLVILLVPFFSFSQKKFMSLGAELGLPANKYDGMLGTGFGASLRVEGSWSKHVSGIGTLGYLTFERVVPLINSPTFTNQVDAIPIQAGIKYYTKEIIDRADGLFISVEVGYIFTTNDINYTDGSKQNESESGGCSAIGFGYQYKKLEAGFRLQFNLFDKGFNVYYSNFRVAYCFQKKVKG